MEGNIIFIQGVEMERAGSVNVKLAKIQREWLENQSKKKGLMLSEIIRGLIAERMTKEESGLE